MRRQSILTAAVLAVLAAPRFWHRRISHEHTQLESTYPERPGDDYIWEEGVVRPDGEVVEGFWRKQAEDGFFWQDAGWDENGEWVDYDFIPTESAPEGYDWEPGYRGKDGVWHLGFWRSEERDGFEWQDGTYADGEYVQGQWEPEEEIIIEEETVYEPGYRADTGYWIPGFVRQRARSGYNWQPGYWDGGHWVAGYWAPVAPRGGYVWVRGHIGADGRWVPGHWRTSTRVGYDWVDGYWVADTYVWGFWRPAVAPVGQAWVVGYSVGGVWFPGYWRPATRVGYYWMPGYYYRGRYTVGYWVRGRAPLHRSHRYYRRYHRHAHRVHYHHHHVVHRRAHRGPHYRQPGAQWLDVRRSTVRAHTAQGLLVVQRRHNIGTGVKFSRRVCVSLSEALERACEHNLFAIMRQNGRRVRRSREHGERLVILSSERPHGVL